jgi:murein L,D-transpeptidase YcbB/YkuD
MHRPDIAARHPAREPLSVMMTQTWISMARALSFLAVCLVFLAEQSISADELLWFRGGRLTAQAVAALNVLNNAHDYGLDPTQYGLPLTAVGLRRALSDRHDTAEQIRFDGELSRALQRFVQHVHSGRVTPDALGFHLSTRGDTFDAIRAVREIARSTDVAAAIASLEPPARPYHLLKKALRDYRELAGDASLTQLGPLQQSLKPGDTYADAQRLRRLLHATGDLADVIAGTTSAARYTEDLAAGVARFQARHGLDPDAIIGRRTFAALTTPMVVRVAQIELTLERWRWTSALERPDIVVNVPQFMLFALPRNGTEEVLEMRVIVGQSYPHTRTPVFAADMTHVIFQPYWDVPPNILRRELLPLIRKDVRYLDKHHMEIVRGAGDDAQVVAPTPDNLDQLAQGRLRLRQRPGPDNALGPVKFMLPNPFSVYLHATPSVKLFERSQRAFSHGCIRVSDPAALARYVLRNAAEPWDDARIEAALCDSQTLRVNLAKPLRVMIFYGTVAATESLGVLFFEDIYGHDAKLAAALRR